MNAKNKYNWIPLLMGVSQLLLTAFIVYWLFGQYNKERDNLNKEMHFEFVQAQNQAMDSTLHVMLKPYFNDSLQETGAASGRASFLGGVSKGAGRYFHRAPRFHGNSPPHPANAQ